MFRLFGQIAAEALVRLPGSADNKPYSLTSRLLSAEVVVSLFGPTLLIYRRLLGQTVGEVVVWPQGWLL